MTGFDLIIVGVGGQGAILASDIIGMAAVSSGIPVRAAETHGMAQRGGSVINHVRLDREYGSLIPAGGANALLGLEPLETLRTIEYLSPEGIVVMDIRPVPPVAALSGGAAYPDIDAIMVELEKHCKKLVGIDAGALAVQAGHPQTSNVVLIGALSRFLPLDEESLETGIRQVVPAGTIDVNLKAFKLGREQAGPIE